MIHTETNFQRIPETSLYQEDEINIIDLLTTIWKRKYFIILFCTLFTLAVYCYFALKYPVRYVTETVIALSFPGIEKHLNPDGSVFTKEQIITPDILTKASTPLLDKENFDLSPADIRAMVAIQAVIPPEIAETF